MHAAVRYALLRDDLEWEGVRTGLVLAANRALALARIPAPAPGLEITHQPPFDAEPSGIAADDCGRIFVADTTAHRIIVEQPECGFRYVLPLMAAAGNAPGQFNAPAGLALSGDTLYVADSANARVQCFLLPALELRRIIDTGLSQPAAIAVDEAGRVYVVDRRVNVIDRPASRIVRFRADGSSDDAYNAAVAAAVSGPAFLALGADGTLYVSDEAADAVLAIDSAGNWLWNLKLPAQTPAVRPRALAARKDKLLVADAASGNILVFDSGTRGCLGSVPGFRAPVSAMAFDADGNLLVKTDGGEGYARFAATAGWIEAGTLVAGPLDAGVERDWERVAVDVIAPPGASVALETWSGDAVSSAPAESDWQLAPSIDCLFAREPGPAEAVGKRRYLWLRVTLRGADGRASPALSQVQAQTRGVSYLDQLPRIYRRDDRNTRFLERWLALFRSGIEASEEEIGLVPRRFDPAAAPADRLAWLAQALAFDPPQSPTPARLRALLARVPELYAARGTIAGIGAMAEIYAGVRPKIIEAHHARRVWQLGETSRLGFDTALAAATPEGLVVPRDARTDPRYAGLHGDYYKGVEFDQLVRSATDEAIDFQQPQSQGGTGAAPGMPLLFLVDNAGASITRFSVRWSGQIKPRFSETYTFHVEHLYGARLWIDGRLLIDEWTGNPSATRDPRIVLDAGRWYAIQLEIRSLAEKPIASLLWSSRSQRKEPVPRECLYSILDEHADLTAAPGVGFDVGHAVVGESGPLAASEFGSTLFTDYAHLFTVVAPAGSCCDKERRDALRELIDAEKPAYTDYHLCFAEPRMRVGFQARLGIDAIVANGPPPLRLDETQLGRNSFLADAPPGGARVTERARLGQDTLVG